jgi:hypothetical protein
VTTPIQAVVDAYLQRLVQATADLPADVRDDLVTDVRTHLEEAAHAAGTEAGIRTAVDRLGPPEAIAAEARAGLAAVSGPGPDAGRTTPPAPPRTTWTGATGGPTPATTSSTGRDVTAILAVLFLPLLLGFGFGVPGMVLGWAIGLGLLWTSRTWTPGEKALATVVWPGGFLTPLYLGLTASQVCMVEEVVTDDVVVLSDPVCTGFALPPWLGIPALVLTVAAPLLVAWLLLRRGDVRRDAARSPAR